MKNYYQKICNPVPDQNKAFKLMAMMGGICLWALPFITWDIISQSSSSNVRLVIITAFVNGFLFLVSAYGLKRKAIWGKRVSQISLLVFASVILMSIILISTRLYCFQNNTCIISIGILFALFLVPAYGMYCLNQDNDFKNKDDKTQEPDNSIADIVREIIGLSLTSVFLFIMAIGIIMFIKQELSQFISASDDGKLFIVIGISAIIICLCIISITISKFIHAAISIEIIGLLIFLIFIFIQYFNTLACFYTELRNYILMRDVIIKFLYIILFVGLYVVLGVTAKKCLRKESVTIGRFTRAMFAFITLNLIDKISLEVIPGMSHIFGLVIIICLSIILFIISEKYFSNTFVFLFCVIIIFCCHYLFGYYNNTDLSEMNESKTIWNNYFVYHYKSPRWNMDIQKELYIIFDPRDSESTAMEYGYTERVIYHFRSTRL